MTAITQTPVSPVQAWKMAVRLPTLTAAVAPVAVGTGLAIHEDRFAAGPALAALAGAVCLQIGANFANDAFDFKRGADTTDRLGPPRAAQLGLLSLRQLLGGMWLVFGLAALAGLYLASVAGWPVVAVGLVSVAGAIVYTGGPWPVGYHALGDLFTFVFFGLIAVMGTYLVQARELSWLALVAAIPVGCTVTMILVVNNLRDLATDRRAGKLTLAVLLGDRGTRAWFVALFACAWAIPLVATISLPWTWLAVIASAPWAARPVAAVVTGVEGRSLNLVLRSTARFNLAFGLCWAATIAVS